MEKVISLTKYGGMITSIAQDDIPVENCAYCLDVDPEYESQLRGLPTNGNEYKANLTSIPNVYESGLIKYVDSGTEKWDLVYIDKNQDDITVIEDFYAAEASRTFNDLVTTAGITVKSLVMFNNTAQIGMGNSDTSLPYMVYRILSTRSYFHSAEINTAGVYAEAARCYNPGSTSGGTEVAGTLSGSGSGYFAANTLYKWAVSFVYEGLQESNLSIGGTDSNASASASAALTITVYNVVGTISNMDSRITGINIYRAESSDTTEANLGLFRLVDTIDINDSSWVVSGSHYTYSYTDNGGYPVGGVTYEENTGIPEGTTATYVTYNLNTQGGGYLWASNCYVPYTQSSADWSRYIFRSKKFRPNMFDWTRDFVVVPEIPTDIMYFNEKLYAFSENYVHRINPELLVIEQTYEGMGVSNRGGVLVTDYGMFFCNRNGAYLITTGYPIRISDPITLATGSYDGAWKDFADDTFVSPASLGRIIVAYLSQKRCLVFIGNGSTAVTRALVYYLPTKQWFLWTFESLSLDANSGVVTGKDGELYFSNASKMVELLAGASYQDFSWLSKEFTLGEPSQKKSLKKLKWDATAGTGSITVKYGEDGADPVSGTTATNDAYINDYVKTFQVYISGKVDAKLDSLDILVRTLKGIR